MTATSKAVYTVSEHLTIQSGVWLAIRTQHSWNMNTNQSYDLDDVDLLLLAHGRIISISGISKESALYCATIPTSGSGNLSFRRLVNSQDILSNDGYSLGRYDYQGLFICGQLIQIPYTSTETALMKSAAFYGK